MFKITRNHIKTKSHKNYSYGIYAEKYVMIYLWLKGYNIIRHRYKSNFGEIDIIAQKGKKIVFIEVKFSFKKVNIEKVLTNQQILRIKNTAKNFIDKNSFSQNYSWRIDFIEVNQLFYFILKINHRINFIS